MVNVRDALIQDFLVGKDQITEAFAKQIKGAEQAGAVYGKLNALGVKNIDVTKGVINQQDTLGKVFNASFEQANAKASVFDMRLLSIMFGGMMIQRTFGGILSSIKETFMKVENNTSELSKGTMALSASWEFLKFSLFNALDQPIIQQFIGTIIDVVNWTSNLINKYPALGTAIVGAFGVLALGGAVLAIIGSFGLFWNSAFGVGGLFATQAAAGMGTAAAGAGTVTGAVSTAFAVMSKIIAPGLIVYGAFKLVDDLSSKNEVSPVAALTTALTLGLGAAAVFNPVTGLVVTATVLLVYANKKIEEETDPVSKGLEQAELRTSGLDIAFPAIGTLLTLVKAGYEGYKTSADKANQSTEDLSYRLMSSDDSLYMSLYKVTEAVGSEDSGLIGANRALVNDSKSNVIPQLEYEKAKADDLTESYKALKRAKEEYADVAAKAYGSTRSEAMSSIFG